VGVRVGNGVSVGWDVDVGMGVFNGRIGVSVITGACVAVPPAGRLHDNTANNKTKLAAKMRLFIKSLLFLYIDKSSYDVKLEVTIAH
jgi:hypothetical protein